MQRLIYSALVIRGRKQTVHLVFPETEAVNHIVTAQQSEAALAIFRRFVAQFRIDTFTSGEVDSHHRKRAVFHAMEWPERWQKFYFQSGLIDHDPLIEALGQYREPFTWSELRERRGLSIAGTEALAKIAAEGWTDGLVVPLPRAGTHFGLVSLVTLNHTITPGEKAALTAVSVIFHDRMRSLVPVEGFRVPPCGLTPREIECVRLIAQGMSDGRIGEALGISASTAHEHAERARRKLDARNRAELSALACSFGIVAL
jgi:DNA-binding CsgD family transcriptional regulator